MKQRPVPPAIPEVPGGAAPGGMVGGGRGSRWMGVLLVVLGALFILLAAGDALAGTRIGSGGRDTMRGSVTGENLAGMGGADSIHGGAGGDSLSGGAGGDEIYGLGGWDLLLGGAGDDFIEAADGAKDHIRCGSGDDVVSLDEKDLVARDCETVYAS